MKNKKMQYGKMHTMALPERVNSEEIMMDVYTYVTRHHGQYINIDDKIDSYDLVNKRGRLSTRISRLLYKNYNINLNGLEKSHIGNIVVKHTIPSKRIRFDFSAACDWQDGEFNDEDSCFWGGRAATGDTLRVHPQYFAIRFWQINRPNGVGRALIYHMPVGWVLFNAYGPIDLSIVAQFFSYYVHGEYLASRVDLSNFGSSSDDLWINGGRGYFVPKLVDSKNIPTEIDLRTVIEDDEEEDYDDLIWGDDEDEDEYAEEEIHF